MENLIDRPHMLDAILAATSAEVPVLFLEGPEGAGATTTLGQLKSAFPDRTFVLFIKVASRAAYSAGMLKYELAEQFCERLVLPPPDPDKGVEADWMRLLLKIRQIAVKSPAIFALDGLHQIPSEDAMIVREILREVLPLGHKNFRFVITGQQALLGKLRILRVFSGRIGCQSTASSNGMQTWAPQHASRQGRSQIGVAHP